MSKTDKPEVSLEKRVQELFGNFPRHKGYAMWLWHVPSNAVHFSEAWRDIFLCPEDERLERDVNSWWPNKVHDDDINPFLAAARDIFENATENYETLFRVQRRDGSWAWLLSRGKVTEKADGKPVYVTGILMDVSSLRNDIKFQHLSIGPWRHKNQSMLDNSPDLILRMDRELFPLYTNPQVSRYLMRTNDQLAKGDSGHSLGVSPEHLAFLQKNVNKVFEAGLAVREQVTFETAYGHNVTGEYSFWPEFDNEGKVVAAMSQFRDVTDQILAERSARLNEARLEALYQLNRMDKAPQEELLRYVVENLVKLTGSQSGFLFLANDLPELKGRIVWSKELYDSLDKAYLPDSLTPKALGSLVNEFEEKLTERVIVNGNNLQPVNTAFNGLMTIYRYLGVPVFDNDRLVCVAWVCNKDTEYKESDLQQLEAFVSGAWFILRRHSFIQLLEQAKEQAEAANLAMSEFLTNVNHELRTPLTSILGYAETLIQLGPEEEKFRSRCIEVIQQQAKQMHKLVLDLLNLSRIEGALPIAPEPVFLEEMAYEVVDSMQGQIKGKGLEVKVNIPADCQVNVDRHFMAQVFRNLVENAVNYADRGTAIEVEGACLTLEVLVTVRDEGLQIEPGDFKRIFERFYRGKKASEMPHPGGTGVGLSICKHVVERHGGRIWAENTSNGVAVSFALPL